ncbi:hypothetical protein J437_LFUL009245 [Ladona fulva]|uniref:Uncharacterized protein n=1 Tax=Ladona fulva TaxID=123851 RepID=A0A8K0P698_LADFU|nr:hypothetical protein J437_LFUL009245 [Ladona fulva]
MSGKKIGTHNGKFHADEVMGCFMLKTLPMYKDAEIVRTRDMKILDQCDIVIDVGAVYDHSRCRYDHHQRKDGQEKSEFDETMKSVTGVKEYIKLSSAGLVFAHYGKEVIRQITPKQLTDRELDMVYLAMYRNLIKEVDAIDNGIDPCDHKLR